MPTQTNEGNLATKIGKCHFAKNKIIWLGYEISKKRYSTNRLENTGNFKRKTTYD